MVNSGSSANLLALSVLTNPLRRAHLRAGDKVAVPAVCWSTSLWPVLQTGLVPVLVDVDPRTLNLSIPALRATLKRHELKAVLMVHVLGNSTELAELLALAEEHDLVLMEDTCESLGSTFDGRMLGTLGSFGTFSFYFSHHMTTIEGGMVLAETDEDYDLLKCLRAHGWSREQSNRAELETRQPEHRPALPVRQRRLQPAADGDPGGLRHRAAQAPRRHEPRSPRQRAADPRSLHAPPDWRGQLQFPAATARLDPCWFGFPFLVDAALDLDYRRFTRQPAGARRRYPADRLRQHGAAAGDAAFQRRADMGPFTGAQLVHERGLFIGCHARALRMPRSSASSTSYSGACGTASGDGDRSVRAPAARRGVRRLRRLSPAAASA